MADRILNKFVDDLEQSLATVERLLPYCKSRVNSAKPNVFNTLQDKLTHIRAELNYCIVVSSINKG